MNQENTKNDNLHAGHRERVRERFGGHGLEAMSDVEALEMLLYYALPRRDTNIIAHQLLQRFGNYRSVLEADISELQEVPGVGESAAMLIRLVSEMNRRYLTSRKKNARVLIRDTESAGRYLLPLFAYRTEELAFAISLGSGGNVIRCHKLAQGMSNAVEFSAREILEAALQDKAAYMLLTHNHLSDTALPSRTDVETTNALSEALRYIGVTLYDHIIVCEGDYVSLRDSGYYVRP